MNLST